MLNPEKAKAKTKKCRVYSVCSGKPTPVNFTLLDYSNNQNPTRITLKTLVNDPHKFLGQIITHKNSSEDHFKFMESILKSKLENLDNCSVRNEYKIAIYERYLIISLRYHFSIHNIHQTHLDQLDMKANKFLKKWAGIPTRGSTNLSIFHPHLMGIKSPSQVYFEGHAGNFLMCKLKADRNVQLALDSQLSRESNWTRKLSTITKCNQVYEEVSENNLIPTPQNCYNFESSLIQQTPLLKKAVKNIVSEQFKSKFVSQSEKLVVQGDFLKLLDQEDLDVTWKSYIYGVPRGVMSFAMRSSTNTLATPDNLKRWKKTRSDNCLMCQKPNTFPQKCTLHHVLNNCKAFLDNRYVWRHDSIVTYIVETLKLDKPDQLDIFADIEGHRVNGLTLPSTVVVTGQRPDIVMVDRSTTPPTVWLFELSVSFERNIEAANTRKHNRYSSLAEDIKESGYTCNNIPFEVGSRGHLTLSNRSNLTTLHQVGRPQTKLKTFLQIISKIALLCSYSIYLSRNDTGWSDPPPLLPYTNKK